MTPDDRAAAEARLRDAGYEVTEQYDELVAIDPTTPSTDTGTTFVTAAYDLSPDDALVGLIMGAAARPGGRPCWVGTIG